MEIDQARTIDSILGGTLTIVQPAHGYRFALDSILLARFARPASNARVLELGAGCGVVSIMLAMLHHPEQISAVELQPHLTAMITDNAALNGIAIIKAICADLRQNIGGLAPASFDYVLANPPYRVPGRGRQSPNLERRAARSGMDTTLTDFIVAAARYSRYGGRVAMVLTASRTAELVEEMKQRMLEPKRIRFVHSRPDEPASLALLEARKGGGLETIIEPPLFIYASDSEYTDEARGMLSGRE
ncbi:MAG TPA: methyltransferase [Candidatus Binataceae bacterium]|nr:methyltransferase [Candidatus Binataceae bacterium]